MECYIFKEYFWSSEEFRPWLPSGGDDFVSWRSPTVWPQELILRPEADSGCWAPLLTAAPLPEHGLRTPEPPVPPGSVAFNVVQNCPKLVPQQLKQNNGRVEKRVLESKPKASPSAVVCNFCRQNGDRREFYSEHALKDSQGNVVCPVLRCHRCELCGATGNKAHTRSYCPLARKQDNRQKRNATSLKRTLHDSSGRVRQAHVR